MTVKELVDKLQGCDQTAEIIVFDIHEDEYQIVSVLDYKTQIHLHIDDKD